MAVIASGNGASDNLFYDTRTVPYALRNIVLGDASSFQFPSGKSRGYLTLSTVDDLIIHPSGYAIAVSASANMLQIVQLSELPVEDANAPGPNAVGGAGVREGLLLMPVAAAITPDGYIAVLEAGNKRLQVFDVFGNPYDYFQASPFLVLRSDSGIHYLDVDIDTDGNMYVLSYQGSGSQASQYQLDIYDSSGKLVSTTLGMNAARIQLDAWRNIYTLDYSLISGSNGDSSPAIRVWSPFNNTLAT
jgi:hypothetical protein